MSLVIKNTKDLFDSEKFRFKCLIYAIPGTGKTDWSCDSNLNPGIAAAETGVGNGLATIAERGLPYVELTSFVEHEIFCSGNIFTDKPTLVYDGGSEAIMTFIKDKALTLPNPRAAAEQSRRSAGIPVGNDYQSMAEFMRRTLRQLLALDKHIIVTAREKYDKPSENDPPGTPTIICPELPGALALACTAMFDFVFRMRTRPKLRDPKDVRSRYQERYLVTENVGEAIGKCRAVKNGKSVLDTEIVYDKTTGHGSPSWIIEEIKRKFMEK